LLDVVGRSYVAIIDWYIDWGFTRHGDWRKANWRAFDREGRQVVECGYTFTELKSYLRLRFGRDISFTTNVIA
jgi:hypothetical protein